MALQHLRSSTADKRPDPTAMSDGQLAVNTNAASTGLFYKTSAGGLVKAGPTHVGTTAPNSTPASGGATGNSVGETWLDTSGATPVLKVWDGSAWQAGQAASGGTVTSVDVIGGTGLTSSGGPITTSGSITVDLDNTAVTPGSYTYASITVDQQGRLTAASNGTAPLTSSDIGVTVQGYDADTAKLDTAQTFTAAQTFAADLTLNAQSDLRFADADSSNWVAFQAPATVASNVTWTLPDADGTSGQVLSTDGAGTLSWATAAAGGASVTTSDTAPSSPSDGDLWYDSVGGRTYVYYDDGNTSQWVDAAPQGGGGSTTLDGLTDVTITTPSSGQVLSYDGAGWVNSTPSGGDIISEGNTSAEVIDTGSDGRFVVTTEGSERARIDSSGRLLVGTSSARTPNTYSNPKIQIEATSYASATLSIINNENNNNEAGFVIGKSRGTSVNGVTSVSNGDTLGTISFQGADGANLIQAATVKAEVDGTPGANDMPGRLVFSTTADGASSPTERMRISSLGELRFGVENPTSSSYVFVKTAGNTCYIADRLSSDGDLFLFRQAGTQEGSISVSGTTVSYNGAHLSRWSQLPSGAERTEILRGSVLSNIDEMCEWGDEDNEQLNRMKVSDVEGDKNVSGVFQAWDDDDDTYTNDFYCAMTGDFIIRIGAGITVERGDLLMSAGNGTAKPQDDDIIRSKTIAKVTSTNVSCTYDDGSYCVPCVLMAC